MFTPRRIILHCSASRNGEPVDISIIRQWHLARGFLGVGYHLVIQPDGSVQKGRDLTEQGAHVTGENNDSIGVCLIGNDRFTKDQFRSLAIQLNLVQSTCKIPYWALYGHYQFPSAKGKTCPNMDMARVLSWYIKSDELAILPYLL